MTPGARKDLQKPTDAVEQAKLDISVIIITKNEEQRIRACLESVPFAAEVIVLDGGSTDATAKVAESMGATVVVSTEWEGFGRQKNKALGYASKVWVLSLDADETVTPALQSEIEAALRNPKSDCYAIPRLSDFCGRFLRHSGWHPDYVARLFKRGTARFSDDLVHERLIPDGKVAKLSEPLIHRGYRGPSETLQKIDRYSSDWALQKKSSGKTAGFWSAPCHGGAAFLKTYIFRRGFLDGHAGLAVAISSAEVAYYKYMKLWHANKSIQENTVTP